MQVGRGAKPTTRTGNSFFDALQSISRAFDISNGLPRLVLVTPMKFDMLSTFKTAKEARERGFNYASNLGADLQRAEVYVVNVARDAPKFARDFAQAFLLGIKGNLLAFTSEPVTALTDPPVSVQIFGGFIDYGGVKAPMQMRLAVDKTGSLVNSWVEISIDRPTATPLSGKSVCKNDQMESCEIRGDGKGFSQSWVIEQSATPKFDPSLPFSGLRYFEFSTKAEGVAGRFYDPIVVINGQKELTFDLARTSKIRF